MSRNLLTILAISTLLASSLSALAQPATEQVAIKVFYGDLDLSKAAGMQTLRSRLRIASLQVCGSDRGALRIGTIDPERCRQDAMTNAMEAIGAHRVLADNRPAN